MKKVILAVAVVAMVAFASCSKKKDCTCTVTVTGADPIEVTVEDQKNCAEVDSSLIPNYVEGMEFSCKEQ